MIKKGKKPGVTVAFRDRQTHKSVGHLVVESLTAAKAVRVLREADQQELIRKINGRRNRRACPAECGAA